MKLEELRAEKEMPFGVKLIGVFNYLIAFVIVCWAVINSIFQVGESFSFSRFAGYLLFNLILSGYILYVIFFVSLAYYFWKGKGWARITEIGFFSLIFVYSIGLLAYSILSGNFEAEGGLLYLYLAVAFEILVMLPIILYLSFSKKAKEFFAQ